MDWPGGSGGVPSSLLQPSLQATDLRNRDVMSKSDPMLVAVGFNEQGQEEKLGRVTKATSKPAARNPEKESSVTPAEYWNALPAEVQDLIRACCSFGDLIRHRSVSKSFRDVIHRKNFQQARVRLFRREFHLSPLVFYVQDGLWHILALDFKARIWRKLPPFPRSIPAPDIDLFKDFLVASHGGLFVVNVGKPSEPEKLFVCNPPTGATEELPPLTHSRHPVDPLLMDWPGGSGGVPSSLLQPSLQATDLRNRDVMSKSDPMLVAVGFNEQGQEEELGRVTKATSKPAARNPEKESSVTPAEYWNALPAEVQDLIRACCSFGDLIRHRSVSKSFRDVIHRKNFQQARVRLFRREFHLSPLVFYVQDGLWHILALDFKARIWRKLPPFPRSIPAPDIDLFKDFLVASHGGLFVVNVGKPSEPEKLFVCNPLTGATEELPPLTHSRHPVVLHMRVALTKSEDVVTSSYFVIAVGSPATGTESLSRKPEVYDSVKGKWAEAGDVPGSDFSLNDHQSGVYSERENLLLCVGFMVNGMKGILAFDVGKREWRADSWVCPLFIAEGTNLSVHFAIAQLVECSGVLYLFSEQESGRNVTHCIDRLDIVSGNPGYVWTRVVTRQRQGYRALLVYPEYTCLPVGENKLCIFNTIERTGVVYDMSEESVDPERFEELPACTPMDDGVVFHSLNPVAYAFEPSFGVSVS